MVPIYSTSGWRWTRRVMHTGETMTANSEAALSARKSSFRLSLSHIAPLIRIADLSLVALSGLAAYFWYVFPSNSSLDHRYLGTIAIGTTVVATSLQWLGAYKRPEDFARIQWSNLGTSVSAWALSAAILLAIAFALKISAEYSRVWSATWFTTGGCALLAVRIVTAKLLGRLLAAGWFTSRAVIIGAGEQGKHLARHLALYRRDLNIELIGYIDDRKTRLQESSLEHPILGSTDDLVWMIRQDNVDHVFVALPWHARERLREVVNKVGQTPVPVHLSPDLAGFEFPEATYSRLGQIPMLHLFERPISGTSMYYKYAEDLFLASFLLFLLMPFLLIIALAIKLDSSGPVFFKQRRYGFNNQTFSVWKFRTMFADMTDLDCERQTTADDPRVTRVGRVLRKTSFDELPQLINVLRGEMSLVGPRPHAVATKADGQLFEDVVEQYAARHRVKPGITGWAQVNNWRGETPKKEDIQKRVEFDLYYIKNWSIWFDLQILFMTPFALLKGKKAY